MWLASHRTTDACAWLEGPCATAWPPTDDGLWWIIADNILDRQFTANAPNQRGIADVAYISTAAGWSNTLAYA